MSVSSDPAGQATRMRPLLTEEEAGAERSAMTPEGWRNFANVRRAAFFSAFSVYFVVLLAFGTGNTDFQSIHVLNYSHLSLPVLAVGVFVLPLRFLWVALASFVSSFLAAEFILLSASDATGWTASGMLKSLFVTAAVSLASGTVARTFQLRHKKADPHPMPEMSAVLCGVALVAIGLPVGILGLWIEMNGQMKLDAFPDLFFLLSQRIIRLGLIAAAACLALRALPSRAQLPEIALHIAAFLVLGLAAREGLHVDPPTDPALLGLLLLLLRPIRVAVIGVLGGLCIYIAMTGAYVDLPVEVSGHDLQDQILANVLFIILVVVATIRMKSNRVAHAQSQTLGRMSRAQQLARYGHFTFDPHRGVARFDALTQTILNVPARLQLSDFIARVHPDDSELVREGFSVSQEAGQVFAFRFSDSGPWDEDTEPRHLKGFALNEPHDHGERITFGAIVDVTREYEQEEQLRHLLQRQSEREGQQTQLFSMISHELRTPASILAMMADELDDGASWEDCGPKMHGVLDQLLSILSDMRQTVRPEQNLPIRIEAFHPRELAISVADAFTPLAQTKGIVIAVDVEEDIAGPRQSDRLRLIQTLSNLVKNAIAHSQATEVRLSFRMADDTIGIWTVDDNGRNISMSQADQLFQPFRRGGAEGVRSDGTGLGLYIARGAMELLGGTLDYIHKPMSGATFQIRLPMPLADADGATLVVEDSDATDAGELPELSTLTALILEDSETMGEILTSRLATRFKEVKWLRDGASGLAWLAVNKADVVITDLFMPGIAGDEVVRKLRKRGFDLPIIGMTAADLGDEVERFRKSGATVVLTKPVRGKDVEHALAAAFG